MAKSNGITVGEFKSAVDVSLARLKITKTVLAQKMGIGKEYLSKLYNGKGDVPGHIFQRLMQVAESNSTHPDHSPPNSNLPPTDPNITLILGRIEQLTHQVADLQGEVAVVRHEFKQALEQLQASEKKRLGNPKPKNMVRNMQEHPRGAKSVPKV